MQIYRNDTYIQRRAKLGRYASLIGMGALLFGLIINLSMQVEGLLLSMLALIVGFILSQVGMYYSSRFARPERPDQVLPKALKGFDDRYQLFQFTSPAGNVLVTPSACWAFTLKTQGGPIQYANGKWKHSRGLRSVLMWLGNDSLGNPIREAQAEADSLQRYLTKKLPDVEIPVQPAIVFVNPTAEIETSESPVPAIHYKKLKDWLRGPGKAGKISSEAYTQLIDLLSPPEATRQQEESDENKD